MYFTGVRINHCNKCMFNICSENARNCSFSTSRVIIRDSRDRFKIFTKKPLKYENMQAPSCQSYQCKHIYLTDCIFLVHLINTTVIA